MSTFAGSVRFFAILLACAGFAAGCSGGGKPSSTGGSTTGRHPTGTGSTTGSASALGDPCNANAPCGDGLTCFNNVPGGYCSENCNRDEDCPGGGRCVMPLPGAQICVVGCELSAGCPGSDIACDPSCLVCVPNEVLGQVTCPGHVVGSGGHLPDGGACGPSLADGGLLSWSASVDLSGSPTTISEAEGSLAVMGGGKLASAFMVVPSDGGAQPPQNWIGVALSTDDGVSFSPGAPLVSSPDVFTGDPTLAADSSGTVYLAFYGYDPVNGGVGHLWVSSSQGGASWGMPQDVLGPDDRPDGGGGVDKPVIGVDPATQQPIVAFTEFAGLFGGLGPYRIKLIAGQAGGSSYGPSIDVDDGSRIDNALRDLPSLAFDQTGLVYVTWVETASLTAAVQDQSVGTELVGSASPPSGIWFATVGIAANGTLTAPSVNHLVSLDGGDPLVVDSAHLAVSPTGTEVYVTYVVSNGNGGTDIKLAGSSNQGISWPVHTVVDDQPGCATHFHPVPFLDFKDHLWVSWVDNRDGLGNVYIALSTNGGVVFSPSQLVSSSPFYFTTIISSSSYGNVPAWLGGYQVLTGSNSELYAAWTGAQGGADVNSPAHVYFARTPLP